MRVTITTGDSRGDVQPYVALGLGLKEAGHEVLLAAPATFERLVREHGLGFYPISLDTLEGIRRQLEKGDANLFEFAWRSRAILTPVLKGPAGAYRGLPGDRSHHLQLGGFSWLQDREGAAVEAFNRNVARI